MLISHWHVLLGKMSGSFARFNWVIYLSLLSYFYILRTRILSDMQFASICSHSVGCLCTFSMVLLAEPKCLILRKSNLSTFPFATCVFGVLFQMLLLTQDHKDLPVRFLLEVLYI